MLNRIFPIRRVAVAGCPESGFHEQRAEEAGGDHVVGFYRYSRWPREDPLSHTAHLLDIAVLPSYQSRGLGKMLMKDLIRDCVRKGIERVLSRSFKSNQRSIRLHQSSRFKEYKTTEDSIVWELTVGTR